MASAVLEPGADRRDGHGHVRLRASGAHNVRANLHLASVDTTGLL